MGQVIPLDPYRRRRPRLSSPTARLDAAVGRLDGLVRTRHERLTPTIERELTLISRALAAGLPSEAAERAERLAGLLEHPVASG